MFERAGVVYSVFHLFSIQNLQQTYIANEITKFWRNVRCNVRANVRCNVRGVRCNVRFGIIILQTQDYDADRGGERAEHFLYTHMRARCGSTPS